MSRASTLAITAAMVLTLAGCGVQYGPAGSAAPAAGGNSTSSTCRVVDGKADRRCTPGALNPDVTQDTIRLTICVPGWSAKVRPPTSVTGPIERQQIRVYGLPGGPKDYELDHIVPISLGGGLADPRNLYPEVWDGPVGAHAKDRLENRLHRDVCRGRITLARAQQQILGDWTYGGTR